MHDDLRAMVGLLLRDVELVGNVLGELVDAERLLRVRLPVDDRRLELLREERGELPALLLGDALAERRQHRLDRLPDLLLGVGLGVVANSMVERVHGRHVQGVGGVVTVSGGRSPEYMYKTRPQHR